jgi:diaminopimelate epimerase
VRIHNPDGSEAEKSGNGLRIYAWWLTRGMPDQFLVWTRGGVVSCAVDGPEVRVEMGVAVRAEPRLVAGVVVHPVDLGNPHAVVLGIPSGWEELGARIERSVPERTNVQFIEVIAPHVVRARIWERGAGHTLSSGSSACAIAAIVVGRALARSPVQVEMEGGMLTVDVEADGRVTLRGPVEAIGTIEVDADWLARRA